jgi:hypothetical protein
MKTMAKTSLKELLPPPKNTNNYNNQQASKYYEPSKEDQLKAVSNNRSYYIQVNINYYYCYNSRFVLYLCKNCVVYRTQRT